MKFFKTFNSIKEAKHALLIPPMVVNIKDNNSQRTIFINSGKQKFFVGNALDDLIITELDNDIELVLLNSTFNNENLKDIYFFDIDFKSNDQDYIGISWYPNEEKLVYEKIKGEDEIYKEGNWKNDEFQRLFFKKDTIGDGLREFLNKL